jgi:hypothetical protein
MEILVSVLIADDRVADRFTAPGDEIERFNYGWSILHCLAVGMPEETDTPNVDLEGAGPASHRVISPRWCAVAGGLLTGRQPSPSRGMRASGFRAAETRKRRATARRSLVWETRTG